MNTNHLRSFTPYILALIILLMLSAPNSFLSYGIYTPEYLLAIIFYYSLTRGRENSYVAFLLLGLLTDLSLRYPLGLHMILFMYLIYVINIQRKFLLQKNFYYIWLFFTVNLSILMLLKFTFLKFSYSFPAELNYKFFFYKVYFSSLIYPATHYLLDKLR